MIHNSGFRPGLDQQCTVARTRYRFISKNANVNAAIPDRNLWIVHYRPADPQYQLPAAAVQISPRDQQLFQERRWVEQNARIPNKPFMLHDREKWPRLEAPGRNGPGDPMYAQNYYGQNPMAHIGNPRFSGQFYQQPQQGMVGPPAAKRQRQNPPAQMPGMAADAALASQGISIEGEEEVATGDIIDVLQPRDISLTRYIQHHEWMEEVFSSPYATGQIVPVDLGFGLMGELAGLTEGLFDQPNSDEGKPPSLKKVQPEQLREFEKRVKEHIEEGQAELERMKRDHAKKMEELRRSKTVMQAEKRLRNAAWDVSDTGNEFWRIIPNGTGTANKENVNDVKGEVEKMLNVTIEPQKASTMIEKGGLKREETQRPAASTSQDVANSGLNGLQANGALNGASHIPEQFNQRGLTAPQMSHQLSGARPDSEVGVRLQDQQQPPSMVQAPPEQQQQAATAPQQPTGDDVDTTMAGMGGMDSIPPMDESLIEGMDIDVDTANLQFGNPAPQPKTEPTDNNGGASDWTTLQNNPGAGLDTDSNAAAAPGGDANAGLYGGEGENGFGDFDAGDGLIDFEGGGDVDDVDLGLDMDNSAFGDAFHGTEPLDEEAERQDEGGAS